MNKEEEDKKVEEEEEVQQEENKDEKEREEEGEAEEEEIRATMQSSVATQQSCSRGPRQLFLYTELGGGGRRGCGRGEQAARRGRGRDQNYNAVLHSNGTIVLVGQGNCFFPMRRRRRKRRR